MSKLQLHMVGDLFALDKQTNTAIHLCHVYTYHLITHTGLVWYDLSPIIIFCELEWFGLVLPSSHLDQIITHNKPY